MAHYQMAKGNVPYINYEYMANPTPAAVAHLVREVIQQSEGRERTNQLPCYLFRKIGIRETTVIKGYCGKLICTYFPQAK